MRKRYKVYSHTYYVYVIMYHLFLIYVLYAANVVSELKVMDVSIVIFAFYVVFIFFNKTRLYIRQVRQGNYGYFNLDEYDYDGGVPSIFIIISGFIFSLVGIIVYFLLHMHLVEPLIHVLKSTEDGGLYTVVQVNFYLFPTLLILWEVKRCVLMFLIRRDKKRSKPKKQSSQKRSLSKRIKSLPLSLYFLFKFPITVVLYLFATVKGYLFLLVLFLLPLVIPKLTYGFIFKYLGWFLLYVATLSLYQLIYWHIKGDDTYSLFLRLKEFIRPMLKLLFSPLTWVGLIVLGVTAFKLPLLFFLFIIYLIVRVVDDIFNNKFKFKYWGASLNIALDGTPCDVCYEPMRLKGYSRFSKKNQPGKYDYVCANCKQLYSPFLNTTLLSLEEVKEHLLYREENLAQPFHPNKVIRTYPWESD